MFDIQQELKKLPAKLEFYLMHNSKDEIIYVGKAIKLCNRVRQYFQRQPESVCEDSAYGKECCLF